MATGDQQGDAAADKRHEAGVAPKAADFSRWYSDVIEKGELLSYYNVPGLYVLRPSAYSMWERIQKWFDERIKGVGVENCMFPLFIREDVLKKEEDHIDVRALLCCALMCCAVLCFAGCAFSISALPKRTPAGPRTMPEPQDMLRQL